MTSRRRSRKMAIRDFFLWSLTFTKKIIFVCTAVWALATLYSAIMILYAVLRINDFSYLDTFITDNGETFRLVVGTNVVSKTIENLWKYNEGGIFGKSIKPESPTDDVEDSPHF